jgi:hypothetical protein
LQRPPVAPPPPPPPPRSPPHRTYAIPPTRPTPPQATEHGAKPVDPAEVEEQQRVARLRLYQEAVLKLDRLMAQKVNATKPQRIGLTQLFNNKTFKDNVLASMVTGGWVGGWVGEWIGGWVTSAWWWPRCWWGMRRRGKRRRG